MNQTTLGRSPEYRLAARALGGLRDDLLSEPAAYRPLPPLSQDHRFVAALPARMRDRATWIVYALVAAGALLAGLIVLLTTRGKIEAVVLALLTAAPVLLTLVRPVAAFWLSLLMAPLTGFLGAFDLYWPWPAGVIAAHLVVLVVVAFRTRPRTAVWMWALSALYALLADVMFGGGRFNNGGPFLAAAAFLLLLVCIVHVRRAGQREIVAQQSVTAVERSRRTLLEERTTIARELHDVVAHHMSVVAIQAEAAPYRVENPPPELEQAFATIRENAVAALTELRRVLGVVRAADYEAPDAPQPQLSDLPRLLANVRDAGLTVEQATTGAVRVLPQGVELSAYRIVQEALSNVLRHAPGADAKVEVSYVLGGLGLRILNAPGTTDAPPSPGAGHGLTGMRERVQMLGGEMTAEPTPEGGFEVTVFVPVAPGEPAAQEAVEDAVPSPREGAPVPSPREEAPVPTRREEAPVPAPREEAPVPTPREEQPPAPPAREPSPAPSPLSLQKEPAPPHSPESAA
ncbi:two-component sensor histidine kinase [Streptomyces spiroverticillatus]|uniref:histidine kinase n=1 Tax=Streptomyces finlayi TaxID=67296 RepID=A0A918WTP3_9ACTN|nr:histidine kinase [Streptomyces finlayi]GGZ97488.1 two-component sensor histidine kinase [Streptomyces spiroverticillatus]GHC82606.1 two-component sensor histidine kinase [Streptomyces finlayi]